MEHPFQRIEPGRRARLWRWITAATVLNMVVLNFIGAYLQTDAAPAQIVSYEFARTPERAAAIIDSWEPVRGYAFASLAFDMSFPILYACAIALAAVWTGDVLSRRRWPGARFAAPLAWGQFLAAFLDYIENLALFVMLLQETPTQPWPPIAYWCAAVKFLLVILGLVYALYGLGVRLVVRPNEVLA
jgi:hypothetical protein